MCGDFCKGVGCHKKYSVPRMSHHDVRKQRKFVFKRSSSYFRDYCVYMLLNDSFAHGNNIFSKIRFCLLHNPHFCFLFQIAQFSSRTEHLRPVTQRCKQPYLNIMCFINKKLDGKSIESQKETTRCFRKHCFNFFRSAMFKRRMIGCHE